MSCFDLFWGFWASLQVLVGDYIPNSWRMFRFTNPWMVEVINGCAKSCHNYTFHWLLFFRLFHRRIEMFERSLEAASPEAVCCLAPEQAAKSILSSPTHQGVRSNNSDERANNCDPAMFIRQYHACINRILTTGSGQIGNSTLSRTAIWMATAKFGGDGWLW